MAEPVSVPLDEALGNLWALEWSPDQKCFHIDPLPTALESNRETVTAGVSPGYVIVHVFASYGAALECSKELHRQFPATFGGMWAEEDLEAE